ncbi:MAG: putative spermidine/putrescine transport system substrate-binding protein [Sulfitobacter sp.]
MSDKSESGLADPRKRTTIKAIAAGLSAATLPVAPYVFARNKTPIKVLGTHVTLQQSIRERAEADLGISIEFESGGSATVLQKASVSPGSFDLYEQWSNSIRVLWQSGSIQPIDKKRIVRWYEIDDLTKTGQLNKSSNFGSGDAHL